MACRFVSGKRVKIKTARVFLANRGRARYQVRAFRAVARRRVRSAAIAQLVEHVIRNDGVTGSSPVCGTASPPAQVRYRPKTRVYQRVVRKLASEAVRDGVLVSGPLCWYICW